MFRFTAKYSALFILLFFVFNGLMAQPIVKQGVEPQKITDGYQFTEGPLWHPSGYLLFSDIPANTVFKWMPGGEVTEYIKPSGHSNGLAFDLEGRLLLAQHDGAVARKNGDGGLSTLVDNYEGKRLNSPNDLTVKSDGAIYFTDPPFGVSDENKELQVNGIYRYSEDEGLELLVNNFDLPNGIAFSPDEEKLYVNDSRHNHIRVFSVKQDGSLDNGKIFATMKADADGSADGMVVDSAGNLYSTGPGGLWIFSPEGKMLQQVEMSRITNLAWGGPDRSALFMTAPNAVYKLQTTQKGYK